VNRRPERVVFSLRRGEVLQGLLVSRVGFQTRVLHFPDKV
jgi:hypothetical protein